MMLPAPDGARSWWDTHSASGTAHLVVAGWGTVTTLVLVLGASSVGALMALIHLGVLVGAPLAIVVSRQLRVTATAAVMSVTLSVALSALTAQSLVWFGLARPWLVVALTTVYGLLLSALVSDEPERGLGRR